MPIREELLPQQISEENAHQSKMAGTHELEVNKPSKLNCVLLQASRHDTRYSSTSSTSNITILS